MDILNLSTLKLNDCHNYYGGAIGNIGYNLMASLAALDGVTMRSFTMGTDFASDPPSSLELFHVDSYDDVESQVRDLEITDDTVLTHFYFHEPEYAPLASFAGEHDQPFVVGMCEPPHPRLKDEVSGIQKLPLVRTIGKRLLYMPRFKRTLRRCDRLVTVNEYAREYYSDYIPEQKISIAPYGVDTELFEHSSLPESPHILIVSRLIKRRGIDALIEALPTVSEAHPDVSVDIVGEGPRKETLEKTATDLGVRDRITFHGNVGPGELVERYRQCYVFCHLSMADGWNQPALEAMASGKPVVTIDAPHNSVVTDGETGFKIPFDAPDELAGKLDQLLTDRELAATMGEAGRKHAETTYSWDRIAREYREVLEAELS